jgi:hypothetical protein
MWVTNFHNHIKQPATLTKLLCSLRIYL